MSKLFKIVIGSALALIAVTSVTACSPGQSVDMDTVSAIIDVRTPGEFAEGHLHDSMNFDIQGSNFSSEVDSLDKSANYVVYCRSGNRAGKAIEFMQEHGFTGTLTNAGGVENASSITGMPIIR